MFIDSAKILVRAGSGGKGCRSFYRDKFTRHGIPDGGDGGKGADIVIRAENKLQTLLDFHYRRHFFGGHGGHGSGKNKKGRDAFSLVIRVPCGTLIKDAATGCVLRDLIEGGEEFVVARGGKGGIGNKRQKEPTFAEPGEEKELLLNLCLIADVGVVGFPNAGKSTLVSAVSNARPKIAGYPFTTKFPILGAVRAEQGKSFIIADIPGLIKGSSKGRGLGDRFLRHIERTKVLVHLIDMAGSEARDPFLDYEIINNELASRGQQLSRKPVIIAANKMDLEGADENLRRFRKLVKKKICPISALKKEGLEGLIEAVRKKI